MQPGPVELAAVRRRSTQSMQLAFSAVSLVALGLAVGINLLAPVAGLGDEVAASAGFGCLLAGVAHAMALWLWR